MSSDTPNLAAADAGALDDIRSAVAKLSKAHARAASDLKTAPESAPDNVTPIVREAPETAAEPAPKAVYDEALRRAEAILFAAPEPVDARTLAEALPPGAEVGDVLMRLKSLYDGRGVALVEIAGKWRFQTAPDLAFLFEETREEPRNLSKAALETLAIIAYCQPVTRAEIEDVRGVAVSKGTLDVLMEAGWARVRGRRRTPGRPVTYGTTDAFLVHFGLESLDTLPGKDDLKAAGLLNSDIPSHFQMPVAQGEDAEEDPIDLASPEDEAPDFHTDYQPDFTDADDDGR